MDLENVTAIVTGVSRGIGRTIAQTYVEHGAGVVGCARSEEALESLENECGRMTGTLRTIPANITESDDREKVVNAAGDQFGRIDVLVNNAGLLGTRDTIADYPMETWTKVIDANVNALFHLTQLVLAGMLQHNSGRIVNITSGVGVRGSARWGAYAVSKFGVEGFTQVLADELSGTNVETNAVNPGPISTDMRAEAYPEEDPETIPSPEDIMDIFLYLASEQSRGNNGKRYEAQEFRFE